MSSVITRFAPSPTGPLHIGSIRTAIVNYLYSEKAKKKYPESKFLLRIEDTDKERSEKKYSDSIIDDLKWLEIKWDDEVYKQSSKINLHLNTANTLLKNGGAYKCICSQEELNERRKERIAKGKSIKRLCENCADNNKIQSMNSDYCIRIKIPNDNFTEINDEIQGLIKVNNHEIDNFILVRNDGTPTYMLSVVVDDHLMNITHIIRGDDHLNNAFRQYHVYNNLNWKIPIFAHIPLMHGNDGKKLSKRHGSVNIYEFKKNGYLPLALVNYLLQLGIISNKDEFFSISSILNTFNLKSIVKSPSKFDYDKLNFLNSHYIKNIENNLLLKKLIEEFKLSYNIQNETLINNAINIFKVRSKNFLELKDNLFPYINTKYFEDKKIIIEKEKIQIIKDFSLFIENENVWTEERIENFLKSFVKNKKINFTQLGEPLRKVLTGSKKGPSIIDIFYILGKEITLKRINDFLK